MHFINDNRMYIGKREIKGWARSGRFIFKYFKVEYSLFNNRCAIGFDVNDEDLTFNICIPYLISLYFSTNLIRGKDRELEVYVYDWSIWWKLWASNMDWNYKVPKWRDSCFHILDFLFGKNKYNREIIEERDVLIPMPEGNYEAHIKLCKDTWKRPIGFTKTILRIDAQIPKGIPHAGKGENSWDCGDDATFGMCCQAKSIAEGIGEIVKNSIKTRIKYGGWNDYVWKWKRSK